MKNHESPATQGRQKDRWILKAVLLTVLGFFSILVVCSVRWAFSLFANLRMEEIVYELRAPLEGTGNGMILDYLIKCLFPAICVGLVIAILYALLHKRRIFRRISIVLAIVLSAALVISAVYFSSKVGLIRYIKDSFSDSDYIEKHYADPKSVSLQFPEKKRNLIFIFLESMETTFSDVADGGAFDVNQIPELTSLAREYEDFSGPDKSLNGGYSMPGTTWTIAGMFAMTAGLPLRTAMDDNAMSDQQTFFPNLTALGDLLQDEGYHQVLMLGSKAVFGGRLGYYTDHGAFDICDYPYAIKAGWIPEDYKEFWGYEDEKLFQFTKQKLLELSKEDEPFHLTMLTVDTHMPEGYRCRLCPDIFDTQYANAVACSSAQVYDFVRWIQEQPFYENTTIVINGDHPTMAAGYCDDVPSDYTRKTYTCIINGAVSAGENAQRRNFTTFDLFPTTLASIGVEIEGDRLGLGTNLYSDVKTLSEEDGYEAEADYVSKRSTFLSSLEQMDAYTQEMIAELGAFPLPGSAVDEKAHTISFVTEDLSKYQDRIEKVRVKLWDYKGQEYVHKWQKMTLQENGTYACSVDTAKFADAHTINFQVYVHLKGMGGVSLGPEGKLIINHAWEG